MNGWVARLAIQRRKDMEARGEVPPRPRWTGTPQMKEGLIRRYRNSRMQQCMMLEARQPYNDLHNPLLEWVEAFGPFMKGKTK